MSKYTARLIVRSGGNQYGKHVSFKAMNFHDAFTRISRDIQQDLYALCDIEIVAVWKASEGDFKSKTRSVS